MTIRSPKTEHHVGKESRIIPIFLELHPYLVEAFERADEGEEYLITRYRAATQNLRTTFKKIIHRAGLKPWPKLFQNLRSTRQTELEDHFPSHVVCAWMGNSESVAKKHYLQVTDDHYRKSLQNPVQQSAVLPCNTPQTRSSLYQNKPILQRFATDCEMTRKRRMILGGLEPPIRSL